MDSVNCGFGTLAGPPCSKVDPTTCPAPSGGLVPRELDKDGIDPLSSDPTPVFNDMDGWNKDLARDDQLKELQSLYSDFVSNSMTDSDTELDTGSDTSNRSQARVVDGKDSMLDE